MSEIAGPVARPGRHLERSRNGAPLTGVAWNAASPTERGAKRVSAGYRAPKVPGQRHGEQRHADRFRRRELDAEAGAHEMAEQDQLGCAQAGSDARPRGPAERDVAAAGAGLTAGLGLVEPTVRVESIGIFPVPWVVMDDVGTEEIPLAGLEACPFMMDLGADQRFTSGVGLHIRSVSLTNRCVTGATRVGAA